MKKFFRRLLKVLKWLGIILVVLIIIFLFVRYIVKKINSRTPDGGINEDMYVDINGTKQWISIYGQDINNPVLLYLHGGPGASTSTYDYAFTRKWSDAYTVVTWDQRNCGKSYSDEQNNTELTYELLMSDGIEMTRFIIDRLGKDKITILGHSWGTYLGSNLVLEYPEYYDCYIGTGQLVDLYQNEIAFKEQAAKWVENDDKEKQLIDKLTVGDFSMDYFAARNELMEKYGYDLFADGTDYNIVTAQVFNPYYSIIDFWEYINSDLTAYQKFPNTNEFGKFSLVGKTDYQVPFYNINGDKDYQTNYLIAQEYFETINAPHKKLYIMKDTTHGLLESKSEEFSEILHEIAHTEYADR